jgi:hypothetical protein
MSVIGGVGGLDLYNTEGGMGGMVFGRKFGVSAPVSNSQWCSRDCSSVFGVAFLEGVQGLLSRFVFVHLSHITQRDAGVALAGCYEPTAQVLLYQVQYRYR